MVISPECPCYNLIILSVQAEVKGQTITWITPHPLQQVVPDTVDITTMLNFRQFYEVCFIFKLCLFFYFINICYVTVNKLYACV